MTDEPCLWAIEKLLERDGTWEPDLELIYFLESKAKLSLDFMQRRNPENQFRVVKYIRDPQS